MSFRATVLFAVGSYLFGVAIGLVSGFVAREPRPPANVRLECFNGTTWVPCGGVQGLVVAP